MKHATLQEGYTWIVNAWYQVPDCVIVSGFKKAEIAVVDDTSKPTMNQVTQMVTSCLAAHPGIPSPTKPFYFLFLLDTEESDCSGFWLRKTDPL